MKLLSIIALLVLVSCNDFSSMPYGEISNLTGEYESPTGIASADYLNIEGVGEYSFTDLTFANDNGRLEFLVEDSPFVIDLSMFSAGDADDIYLKGLDLEHNDEKLEVSFTQLKARARGFQTDARFGLARCMKDLLRASDTEELIESCIARADIKLSSFLIIDQRKFDEFEITDVDIDVRNGRYYGEIETSATFGLKTQITGTIDYNRKTNILAIKLNKAKTAMINIQSLIFKQLEKIKSKSITIRKPYIYVKVNGLE